MSAAFYVYIMASGQYGTIYVGVTNDLIRRTYEHRNGLIDGFTKKYNCKNLVYFESTASIDAAIKREKQLKKWKRSWKIELIEKENGDWSDLYESLV